jgi:tetratricopeptide (TPR) repeat protein
MSYTAFHTLVTSVTLAPARHEQAMLEQHEQRSPKTAMDAKTNKLLQQAGKYILLGKLNLALEQYLKIHEAEPGDTTIINSIGDLYIRLDDKENALVWYHRLAEMFESRELYSNAVATYRKILKLSPKNQEAIKLLAQLYERQEQIQNARSQYQMLAKLKMGLNKHDEAIRILQKICRLDPGCAESRLTLAKLLESCGDTAEALQGYLEGRNGSCAATEPHGGQPGRRRHLPVEP